MRIVMTTIFEKAGYAPKLGANQACAVPDSRPALEKEGIFEAQPAEAGRIRTAP
ncbi:MAG TPA: hypothetical protein VFM11_07025 [Burkholderiales bacterium]|nr:hypothetical protein [Burkholderiales bacterium]